MLPEVAKFMAVKKEADEAWYEWRSEAHRDEPQRDWNAEYGTEAHREYRSKHQAWSIKYNAAQEIERNKHGDIMRAARRELRTTTKDPMLIWMMDNIEDYWSYIETVMQALPATRDELEALANRHEWCSEFDGFLSQATSAGAVPPLDEKFDASDLIEWVAETHGVEGREVRHEIQVRVNQIVEKALAQQRKDKKAVA